MSKIIKLNSAKVEENKKSAGKKKEYIQLVESRELEIADGVKLVFSVSKLTEDSPAHIDVRTWIEGEQYTGPTKKGINFDIEWLYDVVEILDVMSKECEKWGI